MIMCPLLSKFKLFGYPFITCEAPFLILPSYFQLKYNSISEYIALEHSESVLFLMPQVMVD